MGVCTGGGGAGVCGGKSRLDIEDSLMGFTGGALLVLCCFSLGGGGGANFGCCGTLARGGLGTGTDEPEPEEQVDGGFGGAIGGGFRKARSSSSDSASGD